MKGNLAYFSLILMHLSIVLHHFKDMFIFSLCRVFLINGPKIKLLLALMFTNVSLKTNTKHIGSFCSVLDKLSSKHSFIIF